MKHYLTFLRGHPGTDEALSQWYLTDLGPRLAAMSDVAALRVNVAVEPPGGGVLYQNEAQVGVGYDLVVEMSCPDEAAYQRVMAQVAPEIAARVEADFGYDVTRWLEHDEPEKLQGNPAPGYKLFRGFFFHADLPEVARRRSWDNHANLAKRFHGFARYERFWVNNPVTPDAPAIGGATNLQFPSAEDVVNRYFISPEAREMIAHDIRHFIDRGLARVFAQEFILK